jgi:hypothetical protein
MGGARCQREKERERIPIQGRSDAGPWARSGCGLEGFPEALFYFFLLFSFSFSSFLFPL